MRKLQTILYATDFRPASRDAAQVAVHLAWVFGSRVTLLHALEPMPAWSALAHLNREHATAQLRELAADLSAQRVVLDESCTVVGNAADEIVRKSQEIDADLILIGAGDRARAQQFALGPVAAAVVQHAAKPVLAVRPGEPVPRFQRILCPVDQSLSSRRGLMNAIRLARAFSGRLIALGVVPAAGWSSMAMESGSLRQAADEYASRWRGELDAFLDSCDFGPVRWEKDVRTGVPHLEIIAAAQAHEADLMVMGSTGRTGLARVLMGSVTRRVIQQLPCSLLTVKQEDVVEALGPEDERTMHILLAEGDALLASESYDAAFAKFGEVLARDPFHPPALQGRARALEHMGQPEEARRCRQRAEQVAK
jgi:nucleotide-binding universal stress UspA family protein